MAIFGQKSAFLVSLAIYIELERYMMAKNGSQDNGHLGS